MAEKSSKHDGSAANIFAEWAKRLQTQMRSHLLEGSGAKQIVNFLSSFELARDTIGIHGYEAQ